MYIFIFIYILNSTVLSRYKIIGVGSFLNKNAIIMMWPLGSHERWQYCETTFLWADI